MKPQYVTLVTLSLLVLFILTLMSLIYWSTRYSVEHTTIPAVRVECKLT